MKKIIIEMEKLLALIDSNFSLKFPFKIQIKRILNIIISEINTDIELKNPNNISR